MEILMFTSATCAPCQNLKPAVLRMQDWHKFRLRLVEASPATREEFAQYNVRSVPTIVCLNDDGSEKGRFTGGFPTALEEQLKRWGVIPL